MDGRQGDGRVIRLVLAPEGEPPPGTLHSLFPPANLRPTATRRIARLPVSVEIPSQGHHRSVSVAGYLLDHREGARLADADDDGPTLLDDARLFVGDRLDRGAEL